MLTAHVQQVSMRHTSRSWVEASGLMTMCSRSSYVRLMAMQSPGFRLFCRIYTPEVTEGVMAVQHDDSPKFGHSQITCMLIFNTKADHSHLMWALLAHIEALQQYTHNVHTHLIVQMQYGYMSLPIKCTVKKAQTLQVNSKHFYLSFQV